MFINATGFYVPEERVDNQHFLELNGLTSEWIEQRTGVPGLRQKPRKILIR
jgi:3-oxoacyl-[acyl-carrier-protein] synthase-3